MPVEFAVERADRYETAMSNAPDARAAEIDKLLSLLRGLGVTACSRIVDLGAGHGYATTALLDHLTADGLIFAIDNSPHMTQRIQPHPRIRPVVASLDQLDIASDSVDLAISLAMFHHVGQKTLVVREVKRLLRSGGFCVIADVNEGTPTQQFFDHVVRRYCQTGHDFDFLDAAWVQLIARRAGLEYVSSSLECTDWLFSNEAMMLDYLRNLMGLQISAAELKPLVWQWLHPQVGTDHGGFVLPWTLGYHVLRKAA